jgi:membrane-bound lytic murein transglycosylase A
MRYLTACILVGLLVSPIAAAATASPPAVSPDAAASLPQGPPSLADESDKASLLLVLQRQIGEMTGKPDRRLYIGKRATTTGQMRRTLIAFADVVARDFGKPTFASAVRRRFDVMVQGSAYVTGYYLPLIEARHARDGVFSLPIYASPGNDRHYSRQQIEAGALAKRGLELAWVSDPFALYSLMVQGSGLLHFDDNKTVNINYAGSNGQPYRSLGKIFKAEGILTEETLSWQAIKAYLQAHPDLRETYFNRNPSYCFFKLSPGGPYGSAHIPLTPGRAIATDKAHYPAGALAYVTVPAHKIARFAVDQDTGGAIRGPARVDLYLGGGEAAADLAGRLKQYGQLSYLLLRETPAKRGPQ